MRASALYILFRFYTQFRLILEIQFEIQFASFSIGFERSKTVT